MYSEFTVKLINEVKKREILYNNKYDKRPRIEKDKAWEDIAEKLGVNSEKCKKHWKNVRDRFVKIKHARDKHFLNNGSELTAPGYIYYDMLSFMTEFSIKKVITSRESQSIEMHEITPEPLLLKEKGKVIDMTKEFLDLMKTHPILYDASCEFRQYRGQNEWKQIAEGLYDKFPAPKLRHYWMVLMRQYKLYVDHSHEFMEPVKNENIFHMMSFVSLNQNFDEKREEEPLEYVAYEEDCKMEEEDHRRPIINIVSENDYENTYESSEAQQNYNESEENDDDSRFNMDNTVFGPSAEKKTKPNLKRPKIVRTEGAGLDEFDYFGKRVAMQLRNLAERNQKLSRKAEIEVLQLLMKFEDTADSDNV